MITTTIYFQDLNESLKCRIWQAVQDKLLATGRVEPRQMDESEDDFQARLQEAIDYYLNTHNAAQEYQI